jgi:hypothetical protein
MSNYWDLIHLSSLAAQPFTLPLTPWLLPGRQQATTAPFGWTPRQDDPAGSPALSGGVLGTVPHVHDPDAARIAELANHARRALELAMWLGPPSRGPAQPARELAANPAPSMDSRAIRVAATSGAPPPSAANLRAQMDGGPNAPAYSSEVAPKPDQPVPLSADVQGQAPPRSKYWQAQHGIDTGPAPVDRDEALARTANTRRLASEGWNAGIGEEPIFPHQFAGPDTQFRGVPNWLQPDARALWNAATLPASWLDTSLRTARGAYLGTIGALAGAAGDVGIEKNPDDLAHALPEIINVLGAATAQPELKFLPRFPVTTATRFAARHPVEAVAGTVEPYLFNRPMNWAMENVVPEGVGAFGGRLPPKTYASDLSLTRHPIPVEEMRATRVPTGELAPRRLVDPQSLQGSVLQPLVGDRTAAGSVLTDINGQPLARPVPLYGGPDFMRAGANAADGSIWASDRARITRIARQTRALAEMERPIYGVYSAMGARSGDFSTMMSDALLSQLEANGVPSEAVHAFDTDMLAKNPNWPGLGRPHLYDVLMRDGGLRRQFAQEVAHPKHQAAGFPEIASTRYAISEPALIGQPPGASGYAISRVDPAGRVIVDPRVPHPTYDTQLGGLGYSGGLETPIPREVMFPDFYAERRAQGEPAKYDDRVFTLTTPHQVADQRWLDYVMNQLEERKKR